MFKDKDPLNKAIQIGATIILFICIFSFVAMIVSGIQKYQDEPTYQGYTEYTESFDYDIYELPPHVSSASDEIIYKGEFRLTVYTPYEDKWGYRTATGIRSKHLQTCAVDPKVIPYGSTVIIDGIEFLACDCGGKIKGNKIDIFFDGDISEAMEWLDSFGEHKDVYIKLPQEEN